MSSPATAAHVRPTLQVVVSVLCLSLGLILQAPLDASDEPAASADPAEVDPGSIDGSGFIYGVVETRKGHFEGRLKWHRRDAFWSDFLESNKEDRPYWTSVPVADQIRTSEVEIFGKTMTKRSLARRGRGFMARYGDVQRIEVHGTSWSTVVLRDGTEIDVEGGWDLRSDVLIFAADGTETRLEWERILRIRFLPTPAELSVDVFRAYGTVTTSIGPLTGYIQWDKQECISTDVIDGFDRKTGDEMEIPLGRVQSVEKLDRDTSRWVLRDGKTVDLYGTNDVNHENRGIWVETPEWGRVAVSWRAFERLDFVTPPGSGPSYEDFTLPRPLVGTVRGAGGKTLRGRVIFDIDEQAGWEFLNGETKDLTYDIPFSLITSIERLSDHASRITVTSGASVELGDSSDVGEGNSGVMVVGDGDQLQYLPWSEVDRIDFEGSVEAAAQLSSAVPEASGHSEAGDAGTDGSAF